MIKNYIELIDIDSIEYTDVYDNTVDISVEDDETFLLSNGVVSHNSAKSFAVAGFKYTGRDYWGAYSLKGKPISAKNVPLSKLKSNQEIKDIVQIFGLEFGKTYENIYGLRYGKLIMCCDSDIDGMHIKGLLLSFIETYFPSLLTMRTSDGGYFLNDFITPIVCVTKGKIKKYFYKLNDFEKWKSKTVFKQYNIKYIKGLGTLTKEMTKDIFSDIDKHLIPFHCENVDTTKNAIDLAFNKKRADDRKNWLSSYTPNIKFDKLSHKTSYESFFDNEFIEFSMADNVRNIPSIVDGLKPTQRKILHTLLNSNKSGEINVAEAFGMVKGYSEYHHGNMSLEEGIVTMAQDFVGSNNIPLLQAIGSFGTRLQGGKDSASTRYINTQLSVLTKNIYLNDDKPILNHLQGDNKIIEPEYFLPILPMVLINGTEGIGTGWSSTIPKYNINDIITYLDNKILGKKNNVDILPYYNNFKGNVYYDEETDNCVTCGIITKINETTLNISELPIGTWNDTYYKKLGDMIDNKLIRDYNKDCTDEEVNITIKISRSNLSNIDDLYDTFQLKSNINMSNMHLFDINGKIKKYETPYDIINEFYDIRIGFYETRRQYFLSVLNSKKDRLANLGKFINGVIKGVIKINNVPINKINKQLEENKISKIDDSYSYLLNIPIYKLSKDELIKLKEEFKSMKVKIKDLEETTPEVMWHSDLVSLKASLRKYRS